jgi:lipoate-protein ligase A
LWEDCEAGGLEVLRFWESAVPFVVVGYANRVATEVNLPACRERGVPVLRRVTGGGTVVQGPGCLNYSLVLRLDHHPATASIKQTNLWIMNRHAAALTELLGRPVRRRGDTDLAVGDRKFSGNAQRRGRQALLFHGTLLLEFDLDLAAALLPMPSRQPDYRVGRSHSDFVMNLGVSAGAVKAALGAAWEAASAEGAGAVAMNRLVRGPGLHPVGPVPSPGVSGEVQMSASVWPRERTAELVAAKYATPEWNLKF